MANEDKKVSFQENPGDEKLLVVFNEGASNGPRQRKRSRAASKMSMGSETGEEEEKPALDRDDSVKSPKSDRLHQLILAGDQEEAERLINKGNGKRKEHMLVSVLMC
ncbi:hypothetical protein ACROYT_G044075 [Oculina patagonica]